MTYRKGRTRHIAEKRFTWHRARLDGRQVRYRLHDQPVRFLKGKLRLRQVTRLTETGHQTPIVTSRWDLRAIVVAHRMFERWRQENFFKYLREEYLIDALVDYQVEPDDPTVLSPTQFGKPSRKRSTLLGFISRNYVRAMGQQESIIFMDVVEQWLASRSRKRKSEQPLTRPQIASRNSRSGVNLFLLTYRL